MEEGSAAKKPRTLTIILIVGALALAVGVSLRLLGYDKEEPAPKLELANAQNTQGHMPARVTGAGGGGSPPPAGTTGKN